MKVVYIVDYDLKGASGKSKATREKIKVLSEEIGKDNLRTFSHVKSRFLIGEVFKYLFFDFRVFFYLLFVSKKVVVIRRVLFLPFVTLLLKIKGNRVFTECHTDFADEISHFDKNFIQKLVLRSVVSLSDITFKSSTGIIFNHPFLKDKFDLIYKCPSIYTYNGCNTDEYSPQDISECRLSLGLEPDVTYFLFIGSVSKWHGVDYLINIFNEKKIVDEKKCKLLIVGGSDDSEYVTSLKLLANSSNTTFVSEVSNLIAKKYINASNFCLLPVKQIRVSPGSPLKLYDYISCGKQVITQKDLKGYSDEVLDFNLGYVVDFLDSSATAEELVSISKDVVVIDSKDIRQTAELKLHWRNRIREWIQFFNRFE